MKFIFTESGYQLFRYRGRSVLLCCVSLLLCGCIAFYIGSLSSNRRALETLSENTPAKVRISNVNADTFDDLTISYTYGELLEMLGVGRVVATCQAGGYYSEESRTALNTAHDEMVRKIEERESDWVYVSSYMPQGDVHIYGVTNFEATGLGWAGDVTLGEGYDLSFLEGDGSLCLISDKMAQSTGLEIGDTFEMPICFLQFTSGFGVGKAYSYMNEYSFTVAGTYPARIETIHPADMYLPLTWLRARLAEDQPNNPFTYTSYGGDLKDSMKLNEFKDSLKDSGLGQPFFIDTHEMYVSLVNARTVYMDDEEFIRSGKAGTEHAPVRDVPCALLCGGRVPCHPRHLPGAAGLPQGYGHSLLLRPSEGGNGLFNPDGGPGGTACGGAARGPRLHADDGHRLWHGAAGVRDVPALCPYRGYCGTYNPAAL